MTDLGQFSYRLQYLLTGKKSILLYWQKIGKKGAVTISQKPFHLQYFPGFL